MKRPGVTVASKMPVMNSTEKYVVTSIGCNAMPITVTGDMCAIASCHTMSVSTVEIVQGTDNLGIRKNSDYWLLFVVCFVLNHIYAPV